MIIDLNIDSIKKAVSDAAKDLGDPPEDVMMSMIVNAIHKAMDQQDEVDEEDIVQMVINMMRAKKKDESISVSSVVDSLLEDVK